MKYLLILLFILPAFGQSVDELKHKAKDLKAKDIIINYDKFKDRSIILTKPYNLVGMGEGVGSIMASNGGNPTILLADVRSVFSGQTLTGPPETYYLVFSASGSYWQFLKTDRNAYFLYDDKRMELKPVDHDSDVGYSSVTESLAFNITAAELHDLAYAKKVELKVGDRQRQFKPELLERFQKFLALTGH